MIQNKYEDKTIVSGEAIAVLSSLYSQHMKPDSAVCQNEDFNMASTLSKPLEFFRKYSSSAFADVAEILRYIVKKSCVKR